MRDRARVRSPQKLRVRLKTFINLPKERSSSPYGDRTFMYSYPFFEAAIGFQRRARPTTSSLLVAVLLLPVSNGVAIKIRPIHKLYDANFPLKVQLTC